MLFGIIVGFIGFIFFLRGLSKTLKHRKNCTWPSTQGTYTRKEIIHSTKGDESYKDNSLGIEYTYKVQGKEYTGTIIYAHDLMGRSQKNLSEADAEKLLAKLEPDITVHYNPDKPKRSYLYYGTIVRETIMLVGGAVLFLVGTIFFTTAYLGLLW